MLPETANTETANANREKENSENPFPETENNPAVPAATSPGGGLNRPPPPEPEEDKNLELGCEAVRLAACLLDWNEDYQRHGLYSSLAFYEAQPTSGAETLNGGIAALRAAARLILRETRHLAPGLGETALPEELEPFP